jgi:hypothetical protein
VQIESNELSLTNNSQILLLNEEVIRIFICLINVSFVTLNQKLSIHGRQKATRCLAQNTCDPAALVHNDTLFIFTGQDAKGGLKFYEIKNWCCFATTDMKNLLNTTYRCTLKILSGIKVSLLMQAMSLNETVNFTGT